VGVVENVLMWVVFFQKRFYSVDILTYRLIRWMKTKIKQKNKKRFLPLKLLLNNLFDVMEQEVEEEKKNT
jgi:UDP-N-acetylglucosamine pyrophosphorylase